MKQRILRLRQKLSLLLCLGCYTISSGIFLKSAVAQITPDDTTSTTVERNGGNFEIDRGDRNGSNLFHSFQDFSVPNGGTASFDNPVDIVNIFSRVTGGNISNIDGLIRANGTANLFLINPAGIVFGEGARLDLGGSFYGSTADSILFEDGEFSATDLDNPPLITINAPIGLNFRDNPGNIVNRSISTNDGGLLVNAGESISLLGGNVNFEDGGEILASAATVNLGGLIETGTIDITENGNLSFPDNVARGNVSLTDSSRIFVASDGGGSVRIDAQNFELAFGSLILGGIAANVGTLEAQAGDIVINTTEDVAIDGANAESITTIVNSNFGTGNAGNIKINARNISSVNGGAITSSSNGLGNAGNITLTAAENILFDGIFSSQIGGIQNNVLVLQENDTAIAERTEIPGTTNLTAKNLTLTNGAQISSLNSGVGDSGNINIDIADSINIDGEGELVRNNGTTGLINSQISTSIFGSGGGNAGNVNISTNNLSLTNAGAVSSDNFGIGNAGDVSIVAKTINIDGQGKFLESVDDSGLVSRLANSSGISSEVLSTIGSTIIDDGVVAKGNGGTITIDTDSLSITNGGDISTDISGVGNAGDIEITAKTIDIDGQGFLELVDNNGQISRLGNVSSISSQVISDPDGAIISQGNGGNITIDTNSLSLTNGGSVEASVSGKGSGGNVAIDAKDIVFIQGTGISNLDGETINLSSEISALLSVGGIGNSGSVEINTAKLSVVDGARISVTTLGEGNAGNLNINASNSIELVDDVTIFSNVSPAAIGDSGEVKIKTNNLTIFNNSTIEAASVGNGEAGNVIIDANSINLNNSSGIVASTPTGNGGNITLDVTEDINFRNSSFISAQALDGANGGNVNINAGFIIAFPNQNNDIIASATEGQGGNINLNAEALFGIEERPQNPFTNDINASSEFGLDGGIAINTPDVDVIRGATELPTNVVELEQTTAQACSANQTNVARNSLTIKGKGGIPAEPNKPFNSDTILVGEKTITSNQQSLYPDIKPIKTSTENIFPARGVLATDSGEIILTAYSTDNIITRTPNVDNNCDRSARDR